MDGSWAEAEVVAITVVRPRKDERGWNAGETSGHWAERMCV